MDYSRCDLVRAKNLMNLLWNRIFWGQTITHIYILIKTVKFTNYSMLKTLSLQAENEVYSNQANYLHSGWKNSECRFAKDIKFQWTLHANLSKK